MKNCIYNFLSCSSKKVLHLITIRNLQHWFPSFLVELPVWQGSVEWKLSFVLIFNEILFIQKKKKNKKQKRNPFYSSRSSYIRVRAKRFVLVHNLPSIESKPFHSSRSNYIRIRGKRLVVVYNLHWIESVWLTTWCHIGFWPIILL